ncbi:MAG: hypothetical protein EBU70_14435, partial [Actinobacteria bacterium]|nr:hypothetical protein [Actinomycetota bacterium]
MRHSPIRRLQRGPVRASFASIAAIAVAVLLAPGRASAGTFEDALRLVPADAAAAVVVPSVKAASDDLQLA